MFTTACDHYKSKLSYVKRSFGLWLYMLRLVHDTSVHTRRMRGIINHWRKWKIPSVKLQNKPCILGEDVILKFLIGNVSLSAHFLTWGKNFRTSRFVSQLSTIKASSQIKSFHFWGLHVITWTSLTAAERTLHANTKFRAFSILETKLSIATKVFVYTTPPPHSWEGISFVSETAAPIPVLYSG